MELMCACSQTLAYHLFVIQLNLVSDQHTRGELRKQRQERRVVSLRTPPSERPYPQDWKGPQVFQIPANVTASPTHASPNLCVSRTMGAFFVCPERPISVQTGRSSSQWDAPETLCDKAQRNSHSGTWKYYFLSYEILLIDFIDQTIWGMLILPIGEPHFFSMMYSMFYWQSKAFLNHTGK